MEALPLVLDKEKLSEIPENFRGLYSEKDGKFVLDAAPRKDIGRFLDSKRAAETEAARLKEQLGDLDPEEARDAVALKRRLEERKLLEKGDVEAVIARREAALKAEAEKARQPLEARATAAETKLSSVLRDQALLRAAGELDVVKEALDDVLLLGASELKVVGGELVGADGPVADVGAWLKAKLERRKHWLAPSTGGGTPPKSGSVSGPAARRGAMSPQQKADYIKAHGQAAYLRLPL